MMNLLTLGVDEGDMALAASRVAELGGGIVVAVDGQILAEVALPIHGILSDLPSAQVIEACVALEEAVVSGMGCTFEGLLSSAGFACLAVSIPSLKITSRGLARVSRSGPAEAVELFVADSDASAAGLRRRCPHDERHGKGNRDRRLGVALDVSQQESCGFRPDFLLGNVHGGQRGIEVLCEWHVVESDDGEVVRAVQSVLSEGAQDSQREQIVRGQHGSHILLSRGEHLVHGQFARVHVQRAGTDDGGLDVGQLGAGGGKPPSWCASSTGLTAQPGVRSSDGRDR